MSKTIRRLPFTEREYFHLIDLYKSSECLWDIKSPYYKDHNKRKGAIENIANEMGMHEENIKKKLSGLRATYLIEKKKIVASKQAGLSEDRIYTPTVPWFNELTFLDDVIIPRKGTSNLDDLNEVDAVTTIIYEDSQGTEDQATKRTTTSETPTKTYAPPPIKRPKRTLSQTTGGGGGDDIDAAVLKLCQMAEEPSDMFEKFGSLVASQLRSLPIAAAMHVQGEIQNLITATILANNHCMSDSSQAHSY